MAAKSGVPGAGFVKETDMYHLVLKGSPGVGKTTIAKKYSRMLHAAGVVESDLVVEKRGWQFAAGWVGQTGDKVAGLLKDAEGGVMFIDECYDIAKNKEYGPEVVAVLMDYIDKGRGDPVLVIAGYEKEMNDFMNLNPGLERRMQSMILPDFTHEELAGLFIEHVRESAAKAENPALPLEVSVIDETPTMQFLRDEVVARIPKEILRTYNGGFARPLFLVASKIAVAERAPSVTKTHIRDALYAFVLRGKNPRFLQNIAIDEDCKRAVEAQMGRLAQRREGN